MRLLWAGLLVVLPLAAALVYFGGARRSAAVRERGELDRARRTLNEISKQASRHAAADPTCELVTIINDGMARHYAEEGQ
ncbi:MAG: hypothetical protein ACRDPK_06760 [Carbonactinosporaceae bacterium]